VRMKMKGLIDDDNEFLRLKASLKADMSHIDEVLAGMGGSSLENLERAKEVFNLVVGMAETFRSGTYDDKQEMLSALGSNLTLKDKKLSISNKEVFSALTKGLLEARAINEAFEPRNSEADKDKTDVFTSVCPSLLRG
jgi:hypothetical protein